MKKKLISVFLASLAVLMCLTACGKDTGEGKSLVFPIDNDPVYLDPQIAFDSGARDIINNCFEGLVRLGTNGKILPGVAGKWSVSKDGKTYIFTLRSDAAWYFPKAAAKLVNEENEEGYEEKLTADDFVFAFRRALEKNTGAKDAKSLLSIKNAEAVLSGRMPSKKLGVKKISDNKLKITLEYPDGGFLRTLTQAICMPCNKKFFELTGGRYGLSLQYLIGNGPFYIGSWNTDKSVTIKKNPFYHGENAAVPQSVLFSVNSDYDSRAKKLLSGNYDIAHIDYSGYLRLKDEKSCKFTETENTVWTLVFNCRDGCMKDINTRLAVLYGFDTSLMTKSGNMSTRASHLVAESTLSSVQSGKKRIDLPKYNISKAEKYWEKALESLSVSSMSITIKCTQSSENDIRAVLQNLQKAFGISCDVRVNVLEESELEKALETGDYQIAYAPLHAPSDSPVDYLQYAADTAFYKNSEFDSVIRRIRKADENEKAGGIKNAEEHLVNNGVAVPLFSAKSYVAFSAMTEGAYTDSSGNVTSFFNTYKYE